MDSCHQWWRLAAQRLRAGLASLELRRRSGTSKPLRLRAAFSRPPAALLFVALALGVGTILSAGLIASIPAEQALPNPAPRDWLQFNYDPQHSGDNIAENLLSNRNVASLTRSFQVTLPGVADGAPVYLTGVKTPSGTRDLLFLTTKAGDIIALDAHTGAQVWIQHNPAGECFVNNGSVPCYTTSSPAIDPNRQYVYSYGLDGRVHKYQVSDGQEIISQGWPQVATLKPYDEKGSSALAFATDRNGATCLYVTNSGYLGDGGDYQGHVTAINLASGVQHVFNSLCSDQPVHFVSASSSPSCSQRQSGIWARPGVTYDPQTDRIYAVTGNALFDPTEHAWGDTVLALNPDGTGNSGSPVDSYTPRNYQQLQDSDTDLGSSVPALLPTLPGSRFSHLGLLVGKDGLLRLLNRDDLSGQGGPGHTGGEIGQPVSVPQGGVVRTQPAVWVNSTDRRTWVFVANDNGLAAFTLEASGDGTPSLQLVWQSRAGGTSPIVANGVLYYVSSAGIRALNPTTGEKLWEDATVAAFHWESPIVAGGTLYITDENGKLTAYGVPSFP